MDKKPPHILDNKKNGKVVDVIKNAVSSHSKLSVVSAYFTIYAFQELKDQLKNVDQFRYIFTQPTYVSQEKKNREYYIQSNADISGTEFELRLKNEIKQSSIAQECAEWIQKKAQFKSFKNSNVAQPRMVHIEGNEDVCINGSVDFTSDGLGITPSNRIDLNTCVYDKVQTNLYLSMFDELWNDDEQLKDVTNKLLADMKMLYIDNSPELIYYITLYNIFYQYLEELSEERIINSKTGIKETKIWKTLYQFQKDGVMGAIDKIEKYGGCILADSVGLGKTYSALAIIKYYRLRNDRVLVLTPKKLKENWTIYTQNVKQNTLLSDNISYQVLNHTDLTRDTGKVGDISLADFNWSNYDLVVIDESHNFRNNIAVKDRETRYQRLMNRVIKSGVDTKVLLLTATPVNNRMNDIKNQIAFITKENDEALQSVGVKNVSTTLRNAQSTYNSWSKLSDKYRTSEHFVDMMDVEYFKLLDTITIARSRKHIEKYYDSSEIGKFPKRLEPINVYSKIATNDSFPELEIINKSIRKLNMSVYSPLKYVLKSRQAFYEEKYDILVRDGKSVFKQRDREKSLINLMRVNMFKRLESSIHAFNLTLNKLLSSVLQNIDNITKNIDVIANRDIFEDESNIDDLMIGSKVQIAIKDIDTIKWLEDLQDDKKRLSELLELTNCVSVKEDGKLADLQELIERKQNNPINPHNKKVIIFTAFADTAMYLYNNLASFFKEQGIYSALVTGSQSNQSNLPIPSHLSKYIKIKDLNTTLTLFSPISKSCDEIFPEMNNHIDILIATDCISEGQNLQDCDYLVNYDIHWNPVRIIQRFGRIDRIGSINSNIQLVNFWPTKDLDAYLNLEKRVQGRMVMVDVSSTGEENLLSDTKEMKDLQYRKKQLEQLQNEVVDLEELNQGISITDLTFSDFKMDLMDFLKKQAKSFTSKPKGLFAVTEIPESLKSEMEPGVIFTLCYINGKKNRKENNSLFPYYLIYICDDGAVKLNYVHSKKILDYMKQICCGKTTADPELVKLFNEETLHGTQMDHYSELLKEAIENIVGRKKQEGIASLFSKGGTSSDSFVVRDMTDFELINFLILK